MLFLMFLSFFRLINATGSILQEPSKNYELQAKSNEVWRFPILKSDLNNVCPEKLKLSWVRKNSTCVILEPLPIIENVGFVDYLESEKYGSFKIAANNLSDSGFSISVNEEPIFESQKNTFEELLEELIEQSSIVSVKADNNEIEIKLCKEYCGGIIEISSSPFFSSKSDVVLIGNSKVKCCCSDSLFVELKMPCEIGCYELFVRKISDDSLIAKSNILNVSKKVEGTVLINYFDSSNVFGQKTSKLNSIIRIPATFKRKAFNYATTERQLTNGESKRTNTKIYETYDLVVSKISVDFQKTALMAFNHKNVYLDGIKVFLKSFEQGEINNEESAAYFQFVGQENITKQSESCGVSCSDNFAEVTTSEELFIEDEEGSIKTVSKSVNLKDGVYGLHFKNKSLLNADYDVFVNGILKKTVLVDSKKCKKIELALCECDKINIQRNDRSC